MSKVAILVLLLGVCVAVVSSELSSVDEVESFEATPRGLGVQRFDDDFGHHHRHHHKRPHHKGCFGKSCGGWGNNHWNKGGKGHHGGKGFGGHRRRHQLNRRPAFFGHNLRHSQHGHGGIHDDTHLHGSNFAGGQQGSFAGGHNRFDLDHHDNDFQDNSGIRKHQVINRDKVFAKDSTRGVNDVDGFRNVNSHSDHDHLGASSGGFAGHESSGAVGSKFDLDRDFGAHGSQGSELEAGGFGAH